ncbi:hypothetical protein C8A05DRAFT_34726 [Staphylotrichum tortipilum]|uniref:Uncharacterized protein n=1 Tax=Staphylotrichum tortipilum TaxID=2831512 RepID=A0AAN6MJZ0_9PEZI|nr:hypothetical protein C8A05DRAFT_34726 [Staphylotrichum longicolle]
MCFREILRYKCGHQTVNVSRQCPKYQEKIKNRNSGASFFKNLFTPKPPCEHFSEMVHDLRSMCSVACAKKREDTLKQKETEWRRRERDRQIRALESAREYAKNKKKEEEALRRQREERERRARIVRYNEKNGKSKDKGKKPDLRASIRPLWETARGGTDARLQPPQPAQPLPRTRVEATRAPPPLANREMLPQTYPQVTIYLQPFPLQSSRRNRHSPSPPPPPPMSPPQPSSSAQANPSVQGHMREQRSASRTRSGTNRTGGGSTVARNNGQHLRLEDEGSVLDPRVRIQALSGRPGRPQAPSTPRQYQQQQKPATQTVAAKNPVTVSRTPTAVLPPARRASVVNSSPPPRRTTAQSSSGSGGGLHRPTAASQARAQQRQQQQQQAPSPRRRSSIPPPVPPKDYPAAVPAKSPWRPRASPAATRPTAPPPQDRARQPAREARAAYRNHRPATMTTVPARKPVAAQQRSPVSHRPNPMFANKNKKRQTDKQSDRASPFPKYAAEAWCLPIWEEEGWTAPPLEAESRQV